MSHGATCRRRRLCFFTLELGESSQSRRLDSAEQIVRGLPCDGGIAGADSLNDAAPVVRPVLAVLLHLEHAAGQRQRLAPERK